MAGQHRKEMDGGFRMTTNNRMELLAIIIALETLKDGEHTVTVYSDSKYVIDSITKGWVFNWVKKGFKGKKECRFVETLPKNSSKKPSEICLGKRPRKCS